MSLRSGAITSDGRADAADRLLLDEAAARLREVGRDELVVIDDDSAAITLGAMAAGVRGIRSHHDAITAERAAAGAFARHRGALHEREAADGVTQHPLFGSDTSTERAGAAATALLHDARLVLMRLPRSLDRLDELAGLIATHAAPEVVVMGAGRVKHMTRAMNDVLGAWFERVDVSHARQKSRVLTARGARSARTPATPAWPRQRPHDDVGLVLVAHGGVFAGAGVDLGTRVLLDHLDRAVTDAVSAVDLACGNGIVGAWLARTRPGLRVIASDRSAAAVASARLTAEANEVGDSVDVVQADGLEHLPARSERLVVLNPPFHDGSAIDTDIAAQLFAESARVLVPGGELWCVSNSHLRYRPLLERVVGPTRQIARTAKFTVTASSAR